MEWRLLELSELPASSATLVSSVSSRRSRSSRSARNNSNGRMAEKFALIHLWFYGKRIIGLRVKTKYGEIDIISEENREGNREKNTEANSYNSGIISFVEVKYSDNSEAALYSIQEKQKIRITNAAIFWLSENTAPYPEHQTEMRFDVIIISKGKKIYYIENGWDAAQLS